MTSTERLTVGQAIIRFLAAQSVERDGITQPFFGGLFGIFGHGNVAGLGQAALQYGDRFRYLQGRNEQGMVHAAIGYAKARNRLGALAVTSSIGPGATNMVTGAATATVNRLPVLLLPGDIFATRRTGSVLQQIENPGSADSSANDSFAAVCRYTDRINRPEQLAEALLQTMRVLTSPADTGAVMLALPQDVQAEAFDFPARLFADRTWHIPRARADTAAIARAAALVRAARKPLLIAGGGVIYSGATEELAAFVDATGIPVGVTQAGKAAIDHGHPLALGAIGATGSKYSNGIAAAADLVIGVGTRYTDFTTASHTLFADEDVAFVNINVAEFDAHKLAATPLVGDARVTLAELRTALGDWQVPADYREYATATAQQWREEITVLAGPNPDTDRLTQLEVIGIVNEAAGPGSLAVNAAGSMPGDLHRLWRAGDPKGYDVEYGNSCMGYEIPGAIGAKLADPDREVFVFIGDGSWLMLSSELATAVQENLHLTVILVDNEGFGSIGGLSEELGSQGFGTRFQHRGASGALDGARLTVDFVANAASYGARAVRAETAAELRAALAEARDEAGVVVIHVPVDRASRFAGSGAWWEVPVAEVATVESTVRARTVYEESRRAQRSYL